MEELARIGVPYILYLYDAPRGEKEYNRATLDGVKKSSELIVARARKIKSFDNDDTLLKQLRHDRIKKLVSIEIYLWAKGYISYLQEAGIRTYSLLYLSDSIWNPDPRCITAIDRTYYTTSYLKDVHLDFLGLTTEPNRDRCLGSPIFEHLDGQNGKDVLVLLPNLKSEHVSIAFGNEDRFAAIIEKLSRGNKLIFKTRKKQWFPEKIRKYASDIVVDGDVMSPPIIADLFKKTHTTVMFYSSGIYEAVYAGQYIVNIPISLKRWGWDKGKMSDYFANDNDKLYNFSGIVESVSQDEILANDWRLSNKMVVERRQQWLDKYVGTFSNSTEEIVKDIIS